MKRIIGGWILCLALLPLPARAERPNSGFWNLLPLPEQLTPGEGLFRLHEDFSLGVENQPRAARTVQALLRLRQRLAGRTGIFFSENAVRLGPAAGQTSLRVRFDRPGNVKLFEDESYQLNIGPDGVLISAPTDIGVLRGLETLLQLLSADGQGYFFPALTIKDKPRFPWRGLLIDSCRHFLPIEVILRNLDGLAAVKMNVLHWHLSEDQGFRVECRAFPKLQQLGSDGQYYTQEQVRLVIAYAAERGIRVVPEFDIPGHSTSWLVAYPELASQPGPYVLERRFGIFDPTFDPTQKKTYRFFKKFFKEMAGLFTDEYMHIGGDENNGVQWNANPQVRAFCQRKKISDNATLQAYFNRQILAILTGNGKHMVGWDEILQPDLPQTCVIHSWRGTEALLAAARQGYDAILSNGYYIDLMQPASFYYLNDPLPAAAKLSAAEQRHVLGGEATMWSELVSPETIDSRIWPRTAAIAERLWSPAAVGDVNDMYRRIDLISLQLEELGLTHRKNREMILRRIARGKDIEALQLLADLCEPLKEYARHEAEAYTVFSPLSRLVDACIADAPGARQFGLAVAAFLAQPSEVAEKNLNGQLTIWLENDGQLRPVIERSPALQEVTGLSADLAKLAGIGLRAVAAIMSGSKLTVEFGEHCRNVIAEARTPRAQVELAVVAAVEQLLQAAARHDE